MFCCFVPYLPVVRKQGEISQEKKVLDFITDVRWSVTQFIKRQYRFNVAEFFKDTNSSSKTNNFVDAIQNGSVQKTGTWQGDAINFTITSAFPADAVHPLPLLNGLWKIVDGGNDFVVATKDENGEMSKLRLQKV